jgi:FMN phosphatase YigB (HAD superfamily)
VTTSNTRAADALPVLLLDFDGTICVGDEPVWAYADAVISVLRSDGVADIDDIAERLTGALSDYLDGKPDQPTFLDGYTAVAALSADVADADQLGRAYRRSRAALAEGVITVSAPPGLAGLLRELDGRVRRVLVTNAPADGVAHTLSAIGLERLIDEMITEAGKPEGWSQILPGLLQNRPASSLMAVGDIWHNDISAPLSAGAATALIDRFGHRAGPAHVTGSDFTELYPAIRQWAADPAGFAGSHPVPHSAEHLQQSAHP